MKHVRLILVLIATLTISACGGGASTNDGGNTTPASLSGTAARGIPIANTNISIKDRNGNTVSTTTMPDGAYSADITGMTAPYLIKVGNLYSIATASGTANVHPFTDMIVRNWFKVQGVDADAAFAATGPMHNPPTAVEIATIESVVRQILATFISGADIDPSTFNLITTPFNADRTGFDLVLDSLTVTQPTAPGGDVTVTGSGSTGTILTMPETTSLATIALPSASVSDSVAPTTPGTITASRTNTIQVVLSWGAASDNVQVAGYKLYRNGTQVGITDQPFYIDGAAPAATACYMVSAYDAAGNSSGLNSQVCASASAGESGTAAQYFTKTSVGDAWLRRSTSPSTSSSSAGTIVNTTSAGSVVTQSNAIGGATVFTQQIDATGAWVSTNNPSSGEPVTTTILPATFSVGTNWVSSPATATRSATNSTIAAFNVTRAVPAGTFTDCLQVNSTYTSTNGGATLIFKNSRYFSPTAGSQVDSTTSVTLPDGSISISSTKLHAYGNVAGGSAPTVTGFTPITGTVGTAVTITGSNFSTTPANNIVLFGGSINATVAAATANSLTVTVPISATTGAISVATLGGAATSAGTYTVSAGGAASSAPTISGFSPTTGAAGTAVTISGANFSPTPANNIVLFGGGINATVTAATANSLTVTVPSGAITAEIYVRTLNGVALSAGTFTVISGGAASSVPGADFKVGPFTAAYYDNATFKASESVARPSINYIYSDFHGIDSQNFHAIWTGNLEVFGSSGMIDLNFDVSWSDVKLYIDGVAISTWSNSNRTIQHEFAPGVHEVVIEYFNNWHTTGFNVSFTTNAMYSKSQAASLIAPRIDTDTQIIYVGAYESGNLYNDTTVILEKTANKVFLFLGSYRATNWIINNPHGVTITGVAYNSFAPESTVSVGNSSPTFEIDGLSYAYGDYLAPIADIQYLTGRVPDYSTGAYELTQAIISVP